MPKKDNQGQGYYGFDASGLERAATVSEAIVIDDDRPLNILMRVQTPKMPLSLQSKRKGLSS